MAVTGRDAATVVTSTRQQLQRSSGTADLCVVANEALLPLFRRFVGGGRDRPPRGLAALVSELAAASVLWPIVNGATANRRCLHTLAASCRVRAVTANLGATALEHGPPVVFERRSSDAAVVDGGDRAEYVAHVRAAVRESAARVARSHRAVDAALARVRRLREIQRSDEECVSLQRNIERLDDLLRETRDTLSAERLNLVTRERLNDIEDRGQRDFAALTARYAADMEKQRTRQRLLREQLDWLQQWRERVRVAMARTLALHDRLYRMLSHTVTDNVTAMVKSCDATNRAMRHVASNWPDHAVRALRGGARTSAREYVEALHCGGEALAYPRVVSCSDLLDFTARYCAQHAASMTNMTRAVAVEAYARRPYEELYLCERLAAMLWERQSILADKVPLFARGVWSRLVDEQRADIGPYFFERSLHAIDKPIARLFIGVAVDGYADSAARLPDSMRAYLHEHYALPTDVGTGD